MVKNFGYFGKVFEAILLTQWFIYNHNFDDSSPIFKNFKLPTSSLNFDVCAQFQLIQSTHHIHNHTSHTHTISIHTFNHVLDVWTHRTYSGQLFFGSKPFFHLECAWRYHRNIQCQMFEITFQNTTRTFDCHNTWLHVSLNAPWNFHTLICVNGSHFCSAIENKKTMEKLQ